MNLFFFVDRCWCDIFGFTLQLIAFISLCSFSASAVTEVPGAIGMPLLIYLRRQAGNYDCGPFCDGYFILALIGTPLFVVMGLTAMVAFTFAQIDVSAVIVELYRIASAPTLLTIPLFTFAGYIMAESKAPLRLLRLANALIGWMPGGVAIVSLVVCAFFTAFTGASGVTIIALGGLLYPILTKEGYSEKFTLGLITTSGSLGLLFPPSLPIILYGLVAKVDIDKLFKAVFFLAY